jgi:hypothetical protein
MASLVPKKRWLAVKQENEERRNEMRRSSHERQTRHCHEALEGAKNGILGPGITSIEQPQYTRADVIVLHWQFPISVQAKDAEESAVPERR